VGDMKSKVKKTGAAKIKQRYTEITRKCCRGEGCRAHKKGGGCTHANTWLQTKMHSYALNDCSEGCFFLV
jgi:hypothetical protein